MSRLVIYGGQQLHGQARVSGSKNAALPQLAACLLSSSPCVLRGIPDIVDVHVMTALLRRLGAEVSELKGGGPGRCLRVDAASLTGWEVPEALMREMRSSIILMGALLGRMGKARLSHPGGCAIGDRPIGFHVDMLRALGARIDTRDGFLEASAARLQGADCVLEYPSVGTTENVMLAAVLSRGTTVIRNAAREPEVVDLQGFLNGMGARVRGAGTDTIRIEGVETLYGTEHTVIPDRIEAGTLMAACLIAGGRVVLQNVVAEHLDAVIAKFREAGAVIVPSGDTLTVSAPGEIMATDFRTLPYPGFPTDMQPQAMALMTVAKGPSVLTETVYPKRFKHADELRRLGANLRIEGSTAIIRGVSRLSGCTVSATDLRAGACLVLAGLVAEGLTAVEGVSHIDRGYDCLEGKLASLGARIQRQA
ncbi:MAG: UDP-N-acetylglucosamine 1-carboxyvinyltransferase [Bacillota bacterium]